MDRVCLSCTQCAGNTFQTSRCTAKKDTGCSLCDNGACPEGTWESKDCKAPDPETGLYVHECTKCSPECDPYNETHPTYEYIPCSGSSNMTEGTDRVCKPCTTQCNEEEGEVLLSWCTYNEDGSCGLPSPGMDEVRRRGLLMENTCPWGGQCQASSSSLPPSTSSSYAGEFSVTPATDEEKTPFTWDEQVGIYFMRGAGYIQQGCQQLLLILVASREEDIMEGGAAGLFEFS